MFKYLKKFIYKFYVIVTNKFHSSALSSPTSSIYLENFINYLRRIKVRFIYDKNKKFFFAIEEKKKIKFINKYRGINLYRNGISNRADFVFSSYCLDKIIFNEDDIVIDCGANYGDLQLKLSNLNLPVYYIGVEPSPSDFSCLEFNVTKKFKIINKALGKTNSKMPFYLSEDEGDSSIIEPAKFKEIISVPVIRLDSLIQELSIDKIKLLKIEAEGYEPEVLEGLGEKVKICEYIAVDGGYERGKNSDQTFTAITNYLINNQFEIIDIYFPWCRALFINRKFI